jgi:integrase/recombinase XerD
MVMNELVSKYHALYWQRMSATNFDSSKYILFGFVTYLDCVGVTHFGDVTEETMQSWLTYLAEEKKNCAKTKRMKIKWVITFYKWLVVEGYVLRAPIEDDFYRPRLGCGTRPVPTQAVALSIVHAAGNHGIHAIRNRAIVELCYSSGLRRAEIRSLNVRDIGENEVRVIGKGDKERIVPFGKQARKWIDKYIHGERRIVVKRHNPLEEALFIGTGGGRLCLGAYSVILKKQVKSPFGLHSFRHACASHMLENGANIMVIQKLLGHEQLSTTQKYTHVRVEHLEEMLEKWHPRG